MGGYVGGYLAKAGEDVTLIDFWPENIETIRKRGLELDGVTPEEKFTVTEAKTMHLTEVEALSRQKPIDIAFVSMKSYDTEWATALIKQYLAPDGYVVSLQNCLNEERIAGVVGWGKTVGMVASVIAGDMYEAGRIRRTGAKGGDKHTVFRVGEVHGRITKRVEELREMVARIDSAKTTTNLWGERWSKLCQNGMKNGVSAATGLTGADCDRNDAIRRFSIKLGGEAVRVGQALGYHIEKIGKFEPEQLARAAEGDKAALDEAFAKIEAWRPDIVLYQAGADPHINDPLGSLGMTTEQMFDRDRIVFQRCKERRVPVLFVLAGGYQEPIETKLLPLHVNTFRAAQAVWKGCSAERLAPTAART